MTELRLLPLERYIGTKVILKEDVPSDKRGMFIGAGTTLLVLSMAGTQHFNLGWDVSRRAASQVHYSKLKTG